MNEETSVPTEETVPETVEAAPVETPETSSETLDGTVTEETTIPETTQETIWEDLSGTAIEETVAETTEPVIVEVIESVGSDLAHVNLFGSFLVCGTLIGLALLRGIYGT